MLETLKTEKFEYQKLSPEEMAKRKILGRLVGPVADFVSPTRNGRGYGEDLWEKVFKDPIVLEKLSTKGFFGEAGHPADRTETDMTKIAINMVEKPKRNERDGKLYAYFDILDTPNGRIVNTLAEYGTSLGISSRGNGDIITDENGSDIVDPDTFELEGFDVVILPAVKSARLEYVREDLNVKSNLKHALTENLKTASDADRAIMKDTLKDLNIDVEDEIDSTSLDGNKNKEGQDDNKDVAKDNGTDALAKNLQETLRAKVALEAQVKELQEKLAVNDVKVKQVNEELSRFKSATVRLSRLSTENTELGSKVTALEEELKQKDTLLETSRTRIRSLQRNRREVETSSKSLSESISNKEAEMAALKEELDKQKAANEESITSLTKDVATLNEQLKSTQADADKKIARLESLKTKYRELYEDTMLHHINHRAEMLGISPNEIINKLPESYTAEDVDSICEGLLSHELNVSKLPFATDKKVKLSVRKSANEHLQRPSDGSDVVDEELLRLAGLK